MEIDKPELVHRGGEVEYGVDVRFSGEGQERLWYRVREEYAELLTDLSDAALVALLLPAMARGEDIRLAGAVSERLQYNLSGPYQSLMTSVIPSLEAVNIDAGELRRASGRPAGVASGFSAGIDSFCVLADHYYGDAPPGFQLTHLLFHNVGSHGRGAERLFRERYGRAAPLAERLGLPFVAVNSNVSRFYEGRFTFPQTHTPRNASVALLLQGGIGRFMYASGYGYAQAFAGPAGDTAHSDPMALPLLSTDALDAFSVGHQYTRIDKTRRVAGIEDSYETLDVCIAPREGQRNCSKCDKCLRTLFTLEMLGCLDRYAKVFDLDTYRRRRARYIAHVLQSREPLLREMAAFAEKHRFDVPSRSRVYASAGLPRFEKLTWRVVSKAKRTLGLAP